MPFLPCLWLVDHYLVEQPITVALLKYFTGLLYGGIKWMWLVEKSGITGILTNWQLVLMGLALRLIYKCVSVNIFKFCLKNRAQKLLTWVIFKCVSVNILKFSAPPQKNTHLSEVDIPKTLVSFFQHLDDIEFISNYLNYKPIWSLISSFTHLWWNVAQLNGTSSMKNDWQFQDNRQEITEHGNEFSVTQVLKKEASVSKTFTTLKLVCIFKTFTN